jgi:hypothetical protein
VLLSLVGVRIVQSKKKGITILLYYNIRAIVLPLFGNYAIIMLTKCIIVSMK